MFILETDITHTDIFVIRPQMVQLIRDSKLIHCKYKQNDYPFQELLWEVKGGMLYVCIFKEYSSMIFSCESHEDFIRFKKCFKLSIFNRCNRWKNFRRDFIVKIKNILHNAKLPEITIQK